MTKSKTLAIYLLALIFTSVDVFAQQPQYAFRVSFTDKDATTYSLSTPSAYLSQRAIDRRVKYNITADSSDLPVAQSYVDSVLQITEGVFHLSSRWQNHCVVLLEDSTKILGLENLTFVKSVKLVAFYPSGLHQKSYVEADSVTGNKPTDFDENFYASAWNQIHLCNGEYLHEQGNMGEGMLIAVIDIGFLGVNVLPAFDSMFYNNRLIDTWNYIFDTSDVFDYGGHGCRVLSCMAAYIPDVFVGTAPHAQYALYATDDQDTEQAIEEDNYLAAAERADSIGADIINTALGYNEFDNPDDSYSYSQLDGHTSIVAKASNMATAKGILVLASAGNEGNRPWQKILTPGDADSVLTVGSVNGTKMPSDFSGEGPNASGTLKPNLVAMGSGCRVIISSGSVSNAFSGASLSTPILSGLAACLMQEVPNLKPLEIRSIIQSVAHQHSNPDNKVGHGVPDFKLAFENVTPIADVIFKKNEFFKIFPNPAKADLYIASKSGFMKDVFISLSDLSGRLVIENNYKSVAAGIVIKLNVSSLNSGTYFLRIIEAGKTQTSKITIP